MDKLVGALKSLAEGWKNNAEAARADIDDVGTVGEERTSRSCAKELEDLMARHGVGKW